MLSSKTQLLSCQLALSALGARAVNLQLGCPSLANTILLRDLCAPFGLQALRGIVTSHTHIPKAKHDPYRTPPKNYVQLLQHITRARNIKVLDRLVGEYAPKFDGVHVAAAMSVLPKLHKPYKPGARVNLQQQKQRRQLPQRLLTKLQDMAAAQVPRLFPREIASITWSLGRCRSLLPSSSSRNSKTQALVSSLLSRLGKDGNRMLYQAASGAEVAKLLHGITRLRLGLQLDRQHVDKHVRDLCVFVQRQPQRLHAKELAAAAWALSKLGVHGAEVSNALTAIRQAAIERKLYLRPASICSLVTACTHLQGKPDEQLMAALVEESLAQIKDFKPEQLAVLVWAFGKLQHSPGPELLAGIAAAARARLEGFDGQHLGMLLKGLRKLHSLDQQLLAEVAAGISKEAAVALNARDAVRILSAFVTAKTAGTASDVDGMAQRIGDALAKQVLASPVHTIPDLLVCYSKLPAWHPVLLRLLESLADRADHLSMKEWVKALQACQGLGFTQPQYSNDARVENFYKAADKYLRTHLVYAAAPGVIIRHSSSSNADQQQQLEQEQQSRAAQQQQQEKAGLWQRLMGTKGQPKEQQMVEQPVARHTLQLNAAIRMALCIAEQGKLKPSSIGYLADAGLKALPDMSMLRIMELLRAVSGGDPTSEDLRKLMAAVAARLMQEDLSQHSLTVLVGLAQPLSRAVTKNLLYTQGENLLRSWYAALLDKLSQCDRDQLLAIVVCMQTTSIKDADLLSAAEQLAADRGWALPAKDDWQHVLL